MKLFQLGKIGALTLKNRIVMAPMFCMGLVRPSAPFGYSQWTIDYYAARAMVKEVILNSYQTGER